jgi:hypothetical protein
LERALVEDSRSHENHSALAMVLLQQKNLEKARFHAEQAVEITEGKVPETRLLLSQILVAQGNRKKASDLLAKFLADFPNHPHAEAARKLLEDLSAGPAQPAPASETPARAADSGAPPPREMRVTQAGARVLSIVSLSTELAPGAALPPAAEWAPKDVDEVPPAVFSGEACSQEDVVGRVGQSVVNLIANLGDVNGAETITHTFVGRDGRLGRSESAQFEYMFAYRRPREGVIWVEELRDGKHRKPMLGGVGTSGFAAIALVFHPYYAGDFEMKCEGQGSWKGDPVWYVYFRQRDDKAPRMRSYTTSRGSAGLRFKGRAWIAANSFQILRIETDLIAPLLELGFEREHMVIEYAPVKFKSRNQVFWLPTSVDIYAHERGKRWHRNHSLADYVHFAVDTKQKIKDPDVPDETKPPLP